MADDVLRGLERRYWDTGAVDDRAKWIVARVRAGELSEHRARLAADLGHQAARLAVGESPKVALEKFALSLIREEDAMSVRVALAAAHAAQAVVRLEGEWRLGLDSLEAWLRCPCEQHERVPTWTPVLSREEILSTVLVEAREAVARHLDAAETRWLQDGRRDGQAEAGVAEWPGVDLWSEINRASWAWMDVEFDVNREVDLLSADYVPEGVAVVRALAGSTRGNVILATCAALHACAGSGVVAVRVAAKAAVRAAGEAAVRAEIVRAVGPWLLREEP